MAREPSKGPVIQKRVKRLLTALLCFAAGEVEEDNFNIEYHWKEEDSANPKLTIKTTLVTLELLTQKDEYPGKLTKEQIREALNSLKDFVKILEDNRTQTKGSDEWHFTLKLWSRDKEKNLKRFDEVWESNRPNKSKQLEANFTQDEGIAVVPQTKLILCQPPSLPAHFVERPEYSEDLKTRLLNASSADSRTLVITAIHGLGSVGKSTIAAALAHDAEVQTRFCDGILWATLGQQPDMLSLLSGWVQALGDYNFKLTPTSAEATSTHLRMLLYDKAVLLVVDDAWNTKDAQAFNVGGARCQVLVTTREAVIADALAASTYSLDIMTDTQAMELLTKKLGREITDAERQSAADLAKGVGYLPLALELAAAQIADGTAWTVLLQDIQQEIARLKTFDRPGARDITDEASLKRLSLTASLNLSVQRLLEEERESFTWFGVLPEDATITSKMTTTLWDLADERDASDALQYLRSKALLLLGVALADGTVTYRLHDLFHDLACNLLTAPATPKRRGDLPGLGIPLADAHAALLEKYRQKTQNNLWHTLPNDGYIHQHLVWHLKKAGQVEEIHSLLQEESATGNNGWFEVREKLGQTGGYIRDVSRAWELAEANWNEATLSQVVGLQCRYALIIASLNSLSTKIPEDLLIALVKKRVWMPEQGLAYAMHIPDPYKKIKLLTNLVDYLLSNVKEQVLLKALATARTIEDENLRTFALSLLANKMPELLPEALAAARAINCNSYRALALSNLAQQLPQLFPEALAAAKAIESEYSRVSTLCDLVKKLPDALLPDALATANAIQDEYARSLVLSASSEKLSDALLPDALATANTLESEYLRSLVLSALAEKLPTALLPEALAAARGIQDVWFRAKALCALANKLPELLQEALTTTKTIEDKISRADALTALVDNLPELLPEALAAARAIQDKISQAFTLNKLANKFPEFLSEALAAAKAIENESSRVRALSTLAEKLPASLLPEALISARTIQDEWYRTKALSALANKVPELLEETLAVAKGIQPNILRAIALNALAEKLPASLLPEALISARAIQDEGSRTLALSAFANKLPTSLLLEVFESAKVIESEYSRAFVLSAIADKIPAYLLQEALASAITIQDEYSRALALSALAKNLPTALLQEALASVRTIQDERYRTLALNTLANKLPELLPESLVSAKAIENKSARALALNALADNLPELLLESLAAAKTVEDEGSRAYTLSVLANKLPELLPEALIAIKAIQNEWRRTEALSSFANELPTSLALHNLVLWATEVGNSRADALNVLAFPLSNLLRSQLFPIWLDMLHEPFIRTRQDLLEDIGALVPVIFALGGEVATAEVARAILDVARWWK